MATTKKPFAKAKLGSGKRFATCEKKMEKKYGSTGAKKVCASIGRKKYGSTKMQSMAVKGRKDK